MVMIPHRKMIKISSLARDLPQAGHRRERRANHHAIENFCCVANAVQGVGVASGAVSFLRPLHEVFQTCRRDPATPNSA